MSKETSEDIASLAGRVLNQHKVKEANTADFNALLSDAKRLAGSALAQREEEEVPGTHVYDLLAVFAKADLDHTEALIQMVAATVLYRLIQDEGGGRANVQFSPETMDAMHRDYRVEATRIGMITNVRIVPREHIAPSLRLSDDPYPDEPAKPQAEEKPERPLWFVRDGSGLVSYPDRAEAERGVLTSVDPIAAVENRYCNHLDCPSERCNHGEGSDFFENPDGN